LLLITNRSNKFLVAPLLLARRSGSGGASGGATLQIFVIIKQSSGAPQSIHTEQEMNCLALFGVPVIPTLMRLRNRRVNLVSI